jgi:hypothetical protein
VIWIARYIKEDRMWTVGYEDHFGKWHAFRDCADEQEAADQIHYLNGGTKKEDLVLDLLGLIKEMIETFYKQWMQRWEQEARRNDAP